MRVFQEFYRRMRVVLVAEQESYACVSLRNLVVHLHGLLVNLQRFRFVSEFRVRLTVKTKQQSRFGVISFGFLNNLNGFLEFVQLVVSCRDVDITLFIMWVNGNRVFELFDGVHEVAHAHIAVSQRHPSRHAVRVFVDFLTEEYQRVVHIVKQRITVSNLKILIVNVFRSVDS